MSFEEKGTWVIAIVTVATSVAYAIIVLGRAGPIPLDEVPYVATMLWAIGIGIVASILVRIGVAMVRPRTPTSRTTATRSQPPRRVRRGPRARHRHDGAARAHTRRGLALLDRNAMYAAFVVRPRSGRPSSSSATGEGCERVVKPTVVTNSLRALRGDLTQAELAAQVGLDAPDDHRHRAGPVLAVARGRFPDRAGLPRRSRTSSATPTSRSLVPMPTSPSRSRSARRRRSRSPVTRPGWGRSGRGRGRRAPGPAGRRPRYAAVMDGTRASLRRDPSGAWSGRAAPGRRHHRLRGAGCLGRSTEAPVDAATARTARGDRAGLLGGARRCGRGREGVTLAKGPRGGGRSLAKTGGT